MKKIIILIFLISALISCSSKQQTGVYLFNDISFKLNKGEEVVELDSQNKTNYHLYFGEKATQIPLFRCIEAIDYTIYIGLPYNTSLTELTNIHLRPELQQASIESDTLSYVYKKYSSEKEFVTVYTQRLNDNLIFVLASSNSAILSDSLFNSKALTNRFDH